VFWSRIARDAGWQLDWRPVQGAINDEASRAAHEDNNLQPLREMFDIVVTEAVAPVDYGSAWRENERERLRVNHPGE